jgi:hypothetical protein
MVIPCALSCPSTRQSVGVMEAQKDCEVGTSVGRAFLSPSKLPSLTTDQSPIEDRPEGARGGEVVLRPGPLHTRADAFLYLRSMGG